MNDTVYTVRLDGDTATINGRDYAFEVATDESGGASESPPVSNAPTTDVRAELPGKVLRLVVKEGDPVHAGDTLLVIEALKMEIEVSSPISGTVARLAVAADATVVTGDLLVAVA